LERRKERKKKKDTEIKEGINSQIKINWVKRKKEKQIFFLAGEKC
jgi:hypothetical protein